MYTYVLTFHILAVMSFFGCGAATDAALAHARKNPADAPAILRFVQGRTLVIELITGLLALALGLALLMVNPAGPAIFKTGSWIHVKVGAALVAIVLVLASRVGVKADGAAKWVVPVRGTGFLLAAIAVFAAEVLRLG